MAHLEFEARASLEEFELHVSHVEQHLELPGTYHC